MDKEMVQLLDGASKNKLKVNTWINTSQPGHKDV